MPACQTHGTYYEQGQMCGQCWREDQSAKIAERKAERRTFGRSGYRSRIQPSEKTINRDKLKKKLQLAWSKYMKAIYREKGMYYCFISGKADLRTGLMGLHVSHLFPKGELWQLWCDPVNSGLSTKTYNCDKPETAAMMRPRLIQAWGEEAVNDLEQRAEMYRKRIATGIDPRYPTDIWLIGMIKEVKSKTPRP